MAIPKYGMKHSTIVYVQSRARDLWRYNGIRVGATLNIFNAANMATLDSRQIAYAAIGLAVSTGPLTIARILTGEMSIFATGEIAFTRLGKV